VCNATGQSTETIEKQVVYNKFIENKEVLVFKNEGN
jgi:hypothetical protein